MLECAGSMLGVNQYEQGRGRGRVISPIVYQVTLFALICVIRGQTGRNFRAFRIFRGRTQTGTRTDYVACRTSRNAFAKFST